MGPRTKFEAHARLPYLHTAKAFLELDHPRDRLLLSRSTILESQWHNHIETIGSATGASKMAHRIFTSR